MLNIVVIIEQKLGLISFRPIFTVRWFVPWIGLIGSVLAMFIINPTISLVSWSLMFVVYSILSRSDLETPFEDVRSGLFSSFSEWAAKHTAGLSHKQERSWKPNLLVPCTDSAAIMGSFTLIKDIAFSKGSATLMGVSDSETGKLLQSQLKKIAEAFKKAGVFSSTSLMKTDNFAEGVNFGNQALSSAFFKPNIIFLTMLEDPRAIRDYPLIIDEARELEVGVILYVAHPKALLGQTQKVNIWIDDRAGKWNLEKGTGNIDLAVLTAYKLMKNWTADIRLISVINDKASKKLATNFLRDIADLARLPIKDQEVLVGDLDEVVLNGPYADINIFAIDSRIDLDYYSAMIHKTNTSCLFILDSGHENILA